MQLRERFGILGTSSGLVQADVTTVADCFLKWQSEIGGKFNFKMKSEPLLESHETALLKLFPLVAPISKKYLFLPTINGWTAFFSNAIMGTDAAGPMHILSQRLKTVAIRATACPHTMPEKISKDSHGMYGANILEVYNEMGDIARSIFAANDGGKWKFGQSGEPFPFEDLLKYQIKNIKDRFTEEMLKKYLSTLAVDVFDDTAFSTNGNCGILVHRIDNLPTQKTLTLEQSLKKTMPSKK